MKITNDKYYTPTDLAKRLIDITYSVIGKENITSVIEPSAGNGSFSLQIEGCVSYDIEPEHESIIQADFLTEEISYKKGRLCIGNPPFGTSNSLSVKFYNKCCSIGDYVAFIQPISQYQNNLQMFLFDLVYSEDLGVLDYSGRDLHCCFNIYKRPSSGFLNPRPDFTLQDVTIIEHRRVKGDYQTAKNKEIAPNYDYAMCNWGNGSLGKQPNYIGEYAQEVYFYIHNKEFKEQILDLVSYDKIREYVNSVSMKKISKMRLYKYLKDNIPNIK